MVCRILSIDAALLKTPKATCKLQENASFRSTVVLDLGSGSAVLREGRRSPQRSSRVPPVLLWAGLPATRSNCLETPPAWP